MGLFGRFSYLKLLYTNRGASCYPFLMKKLFVLPIFAALLVSCGQTPDGPSPDPSLKELYKDSTLSYEGIEEYESEIDRFFDNFTNEDHPYGEKFFLNIEQDGCQACIKAYPFIESGLNKLKQTDNQDVKLYTIFADEENGDGENLFSKYLLSRHSYFFDRGVETYLLSNFGKYEDHRSRDYIGPNENFSTPTIYFVDFSESAPHYTSSNGISEVFQGVTSENDIIDAFYHQGRYAEQI